ncbi:uncharacterized protein [Oscarella lobularis]|uniref:uncharacterized protein n=1 Tax=Oscarella lobularis TaxID=121494 RepID=UPI003313152F
MVLFFIFLSLSLVWPTIVADPSLSKCRFAKEFSTEDLVTSPSKREQFIALAMEYEGRFNQPSVGYNGPSGHTYDSHLIDYRTGELQTSFNANPLGEIYVKAGNESVNSETRIIDILTRKISTYEKFRETYPGYGGYMPWVTVNDTGIHPTRGYQNPYQCPSLDNGELIWALYLTYNVLNDRGYGALGKRYKSQFDTMIKYGKMMFYEGNGIVSGKIIIKNASATPFPDNYAPQGSYSLDDPYEGELFTVFLDLFANWGSNESDRDAMWIEKRSQLASVDYETPRGPITV